MLQGMFRKRGRPPEPEQLPIAGYDKPEEREVGQIPVHQSLEAPRQLPLPSVREFDQDVVMQPDSNADNSLSVPPFSRQQDDDMSNSQDRRLALNPLHVSQDPIAGWTFVSGPKPGLKNCVCENKVYPAGADQSYVLNMKNGRPYLTKELFWRVMEDIAGKPAGRRQSSLQDINGVN